VSVLTISWIAILACLSVCLSACLPVCLPVSLRNVYVFIERFLEVRSCEGLHISSTSVLFRKQVKYSFCGSYTADLRSTIFWPYHPNNKKAGRYRVYWEQPASLLRACLTLQPWIQRWRKCGDLAAKHEFQNPPNNFSLIRDLPKCTAVNRNSPFFCCIRCGPDEECILNVVPRRDGARNSG